MADFLASHDQKNQKILEFSKLFERIFDTHLQLRNRMWLKLVVHKPSQPNKQYGTTLSAVVHRGGEGFFVLFVLLVLVWRGYAGVSGECILVTLSPAPGRQTLA